jgi:hypothetical protein
MDKHLQIPLNAKDEKGRVIPASFIHFWNDTTAAEVENEKLKQQVDALIMNHTSTSNLETSIADLNEKLEPISVDVSYIRRIYSKPAKTTTKVTKSDKEFKKQQLKSAILRQGR